MGAAAVAAGAAAQAVTGIGFALVCTPFLVVTSGSREGVREAILLSSVLNVAVLAREGRRVLVGRAVALWVPAALVTPLVAAAVRRAPAAVLTLLAGVLTVLAAMALGAGLRAGAATGRAGAVAAGVVSGAMNMVAGIGGPAAALYALNAGWAPESTRPTLQAYFLALNAVALASLGLPTVTLAQVAGLLGGWLAGSLVARRVPGRAAFWATLGLAVAGGCLAIAQAAS